MSEPIEGKVIEPSLDRGSDWDTPVRTSTNYSAQMSFYPLIAEAQYNHWRKREEQLHKDRIAERAGFSSWEDWINAASSALKPITWGRGLGEWQETPREELKRRLNLRLQGTHPGEPINWKGLK